MAFRSRGLPSHGCNKCRSRKIKCDENKPVCGNCQKTGYQECKYRDEFERIWRCQTDKTVEKVHGSQRELAESRIVKPELVPSDTQVLSRFFYDWAVEPGNLPGMSISWFNALPTMYGSPSSNGLLLKSIEALANANYGRRFNHPVLLKKAVKLCGEALCMLRNTLLPTCDVPIYDVLASVVMLGIYEVFFDESIASNGSWMSHVGGASVLLKRQSQNKCPQKPLEVQISTIVFRQMLHGCLIAGRAPTVSMEQVAIPQLPELNHIYTHTDLIYQAALLCGDWRAAFEGTDTIAGLEKLAIIASRGMSLNNKLDEWSRHLPYMCTYNIEPIAEEPYPEWLQPLLMGSWTPQNSHAYVSPVTQMLWRFYWETKMILSQALLYTSFILDERLFPSNPVSPHLKEIEHCLLSTTDRLCESCLSPLVLTSRKKSHNFKIEEITSLDGYLMLQILPTVRLCFQQVVISGVDLQWRKDWVDKMNQFLKLHLGFSKATAEVDLRNFSSLPVQIWSVTG